MGLGLSKLWKSDPPPPPPDFKAEAAATAKSAQAAQTASDYANRPTIETPFGTESWSGVAGTDPYGNPIINYTNKTTLNPQSQALLDAQQGGELAKANIAQNQLGRIGESFNQPFDTSGMTALGAVPQAGNLQGGQGIMAGLDTASLGAMPQADAAERQRIENMLFERMAPQHAKTQAALEARVGNMGLERGSPRWDEEMNKLQQAQAGERFNAMQTGGQEMERMFNMGMSGRKQGWEELMGAGDFQNRAQQQGFSQNALAGAQNFGQQMQQSAYQNQLRQQEMSEAERERSRGLNEYNALMTGAQVGMPGMPDFTPSKSAGGADYAAAARDQQKAQMDAYNAKQAGSQGLMSGLTSLGGLAMKAAPLLMASDRRLKSRIVRVGMHPLGIGIYEYDIAGQRQRGVLAQELQRVAPQYVYTHPEGYLMVDYGSL